MDAIGLIANLKKLHTTDLGIVKIKKNLSLDVDSVALWYRDENAEIARKGKNWYVNIADCQITVNAYSYTTITAFKAKR